MPLNASGDRPHVTLAVAPSRKLKHRIPKEDLVKRAVALKELLYPGVLPDQPERFDGTMVTFEVHDISPVAALDRCLVVRDTGYVELYWPVDSQVDDPAGRHALPLVEIVDPLWRILGVVGTREYDRRVLAKQARRGRRHRRVDMKMFVASGALNDQGYRVEWTDLEFPGRRPAGRARLGAAAYDPTGLASSSLQSLPQTADRRKLTKIVIDDLLRQCQYHGVDGVADDVIGSLVGVPPAARGTHPIELVEDVL